jgi:hypothetical protein
MAFALYTANFLDLTLKGKQPTLHDIKFSTPSIPLPDAYTTTNVNAKFRIRQSNGKLHTRHCCVICSCDTSIITPSTKGSTHFHVLTCGKCDEWVVLKLQTAGRGNREARINWIDRHSNRCTPVLLAPAPTPTPAPAPGPTPLSCQYPPTPVPAPAPLSYLPTGNHLQASPRNHALNKTACIRRGRNLQIHTLATQKSLEEELYRAKKRQKSTRQSVIPTNSLFSSTSQRQLTVQRYSVVDNVTWIAEGGFSKIATTTVVPKPNSFNAKPSSVVIKRAKSTEYVRYINKELKIFKQLKRLHRNECTNSIVNFYGILDSPSNMSGAGENVIVMEKGFGDFNDLVSSKTLSINPKSIDDSDAALRKHFICQLAQIRHDLLMIGLFHCDLKPANIILVLRPDYLSTEQFTQHRSRHRNKMDCIQLHNMVLKLIDLNLSTFNKQQAHTHFVNKVGTQGYRQVEMVPATSTAASLHVGLMDAYGLFCCAILLLRGKSISEMYIEKKIWQGKDKSKQKADFNNVLGRIHSWFSSQFQG